MYAKEADIVDVRFETDAQDISWLNDPGTISPATAHWGVWPLQYYSTEPGYGPPGCAGSYWMAMYTGVLADDPFNDECPEDDPHCVRGPTWAWAWGQEE